jgi:hypothetical protein
LHACFIRKDVIQIQQIGSLEGTRKDVLTTKSTKYNRSIETNFFMYFVLFVVQVHANKPICFWKDSGLSAGLTTVAQFIASAIRSESGVK